MKLSTEERDRLIKAVNDPKNKTNVSQLEHGVYLVGKDTYHFKMVCIKSDVKRLQDYENNKL